jgi:hypothetical protein
MHTGAFVTLAEKARRVPGVRRLLGAEQIYLRGDGCEPAVLAALKAAGVSRAMLIIEAWDDLLRHPDTIRRAVAGGYLIAPYDSYNSIHSPDAAPDDTWETAQLGRRLYESGAIRRYDGKPRPGFNRKGYLLSPLVAQQAVQERVRRLRRSMSTNAWFIDCDAFGQVYEDYSSSHPASEAQDTAARLKRMRWIRDRYRLVIGSEGGAAYAASTIHFAQGMITPVIGWGDPDLSDRTSPYFTGGWSQPFVQPLLKPKYYRPNLDPRFRLPLYETVFHDSLVATDHPGSPITRFRDQIVVRMLTSALYQVPPLFLLDRRELRRQRPLIAAHARFFSPMHRQTGLMPLTRFEWLSPDRLLQRTTFGARTQVIANFDTRPRRAGGLELPARSVAARLRRSAPWRMFRPAEALRRVRPLWPPASHPGAANAAAAAPAGGIGAGPTLVPLARP